MYVYWVWKVQCHINEIDKLIMLHSRGKNSSVVNNLEKSGILEKIFVGIQQLLLGKCHIYIIVWESIDKKQA